jgi:hypothetical protein
MAPFFRWRFVV